MTNIVCIFCFLSTHFKLSTHLETASRLNAKHLWYFWKSTTQEESIFSKWLWLSNISTISTKDLLSTNWHLTLQKHNFWTKVKPVSLKCVTVLLKGGTANRTPVQFRTNSTGRQHISPLYDNVNSLKKLTPESLLLKHTSYWNTDNRWPKRICEESTTVQHYGW